MAAHYSTAIVPARPRKPPRQGQGRSRRAGRDALIIAKLRNRRFFSLPELNAAIRECLVTLNDRVSRHLGASPAHLVRRDRPIGLEGRSQQRLTSTPNGSSARPASIITSRSRSTTLGAALRCCVRRCGRGSPRGPSSFSIKSNRVAVHVRSSSNRRHTTVREHMPSSHRRYADWTPERIQRRGERDRPKTSALIEIILRERTHPEQRLPRFDRYPAARLQLRP